MPPMSEPSVRFADAPPANGRRRRDRRRGDRLRDRLLRRPRRAAGGGARAPCGAGDASPRRSRPAPSASSSTIPRRSPPFARASSSSTPSPSEPASTAGTSALRHGGYLFCSLTDATLERSRRLRRRASATWGLTDVELLSGDEARARWPWLSRWRARRPLPSRRRLARRQAADRRLRHRRVQCGRIPYATPGGGATFVTRAPRDRDRPRRGPGRRAFERRAATSPPTPSSSPRARSPPGWRPWRASTSSCVPRSRQKLVIPELPSVPPDAPMTIEEETAAHWRPSMRGCLALFTDPDTQAGEPHDPVPIEHDWAFGLLDPGLGPRAGAGGAVLARRVGERRVIGALVPPGRPVRVHARPPPLPRAGRPGRPAPQRRLFGARDHGRERAAAGWWWTCSPVARTAATNPFRPDRTFDDREHDIL